MNGFKLIADSYRKLVDEGKMAAEEAARTIRINDFLATCDDEDIYTMVDSSAFNDIIRTFCRKAIREAKVDDDEDDREIEKKIMNELRWLFSEKRCKEVMEN